MYINQKDSRPFDTVHRIRAILARYGITVYEKGWYSYGERIHSVLLVVAGTSVKTEGKGTSIPFALASAYGELMERLQNCTALWGEHVDYPDSRMVKLSSILKDKDLVSPKNMGDSMIAMHLKAGRKVADAVPFYHYNSGKVKHLPLQIIDQEHTSNGMCAGNTSSEALVQGLSESFERHMLSEIMHKRCRDLPEVPESKVKRLLCYPMIEKVRRGGFKVIVKDCSHSGRFPVAGVLFCREDLSLYSFRLGSAPVFDTAVQRCITEAFQGYNDWAFDKDTDGVPLKDMFAEAFIKDRGSLYDEKNMVNESYNCRGAWPRQILCNSGQPALGKIFMRQAVSTSRLLDHMLKSVIDNKLDLFVRDVSYMGFPAYRTYIPGMRKLGPHVFEYEEMQDKLVCAVKKIHTLSRADIEGLVAGFERCVMPFWADSCPSLFHKDFYLLMIYLCIYLKKTEKVIRHGILYKNAVSFFADEDQLLFIRCLIMVAQFKYDNMSDAAILKSLGSFFERGMIRGIFQLFERRGKKLRPSDMPRFDVSYKTSNEGRALKAKLHKMVQKTIDQSSLLSLCPSKGKL